MQRTTRGIKNQTETRKEMPAIIKIDIYRVDVVAAVLLITLAELSG